MFVVAPTSNADVVIVTTSAACSAERRALASARLRDSTASCANRTSDLAWISSSVSVSFACSSVIPRCFSTTYYLFEGGLRKVAERQRGITLDQAKLTYTELEIQARSEVRLAQEEVLSRTRALTSARRAADQAGEVVTITTSAFEVGATTNIEVIDAQREARDADTAVAIAENALQRARLALLVALGRFK